jgi:hypothetical protein
MEGKKNEINPFVCTLRGIVDKRLAVFFKYKKMASQHKKLPMEEERKPFSGRALQVSAPAFTSLLYVFFMGLACLFRSS